MRIREYDPSTDTEQLRECVIALQDFEHGIDSRIPCGADIVDEYVPQMLERCRAHDGAILIAEVDGTVCGYVMILTSVRSDELADGDYEHGRVADLVVAANQRGSGLGRKLLEAAEDYARTHGVRSLRVGVLSANTAAKTLYDTSGYMDVAVELEKRLIPKR